MDDQFIIAPELSWLSFNARVLQEADNPDTPLKNRIRFLGIYSNNRDEFFRKPMPAIKQLIQLKDKKRKKILRKKTNANLDQIYRIIIAQQRDFNRIWKQIKKDLKKENIYFIDDRSLNSKQKQFVIDYYDQEVSSAIIPIFLDNIPKWPSYEDENIFLGIAMKKTTNSLRQKFAIIEIPTKNYPRFITLPTSHRKKYIMLLEDVIRFNLPRIFGNLGYKYFEAHMFKVTKDGNFNIDDDISTSMVQKIEKGVKNRRKSHAISFLYDDEMNQDLLNYLKRKLNLSPKNIVIPGGKIRNFRDFINFPLISVPRQKQKPFKHPLLAKMPSVCDLVMQRDILLYFPYHSFNSIIEMLNEAAMDQNVKSIKITAYRLADNSKVCNALINAARAGKQVHVVLELRAYFNERANLEWQKKLEDEGVKVFLGLPGMKVHAKIGIITKKEGNKLLHYGFVGTGNLNEKTALTYTDLFLLTSNIPIMDDVNRVFNVLENPSKNWHQLSKCKTLLVSPVNMRATISQKINREIESAKAGDPARMMIVLNSLSDEKLIRLLYTAAESGVKIKLIVRGIFCAGANRKQFAQPITAISIVDEFLEHNRIWYFNNDGNQEIYIASADWNERNLDHRIEVAVPILDPAIKEEIKDILKLKLKDNVKARTLDKELSNHFVSSKGKKKVRSQLAIYKYLKNKRENA